jgi:hypothetical protein
VRIQGLVRCRRWRAAGIGGRSSGRRHEASIVAAAVSYATVLMEMGGGLRSTATSMGNGGDRRRRGRWRTSDAEGSAEELQGPPQGCHAPSPRGGDDKDGD